MGISKSNTNLVAHQISSFSIPTLCKQLSTAVPHIWSLITRLLNINMTENDAVFGLDAEEKMDVAQRARLIPIVSILSMLKMPRLHNI